MEEYEPEEDLRNWRRRDWRTIIKGRGGIRGEEELEDNEF